MIVLGIGIDIVSVNRIEKLYGQFGIKLVNKLFPEGIDYCLKKRKGELYGCIAARFALKEATVKALHQAGFKTTISKITVLGGGGKIELRVEGLSKEIELLFSISHEREFAVAVVNVVKRELPP